MSYVATSATVTKDGTVVTINTGDDVSTIEDKSLLAFNGQTIVTIVKAYTDSSGNQFIQLALPWPYATQTNKPLIVVPTSADHAAATKEIRRVIDSLQVASTEEAVTGADGSKIMTPKSTKAALASHLDARMGDINAELENVRITHPYPWAMRKVEFEANRKQNNEKFAASGFVHFGQHRVTTSSYAPINDGLWIFSSTPNVLLMGASSSAPAGDSKTNNPIIAVAGVITKIEGLDYAGQNSNVRFPPAEDGTRTYDSATGVSVTHATPAIAFASETETNKVVTDRVDMWGFEAYLREVSDDDPFVYANGLIQSLAENISGVTTVSDNVRPITYFAWYEGGEDRRGKGVNWQTASEADRIKIASDPVNNIYFDDETGKFYQWCIRGRSFAGAGNGDFLELESSNPESILRFRDQYRIGTQGISDVARAGSGSYFFASTDYPSQNEKPFAGVFTHRKSTAHQAAVNGECHFLVCGTVNRLNQGAYHPSFNPSGTRGWRHNIASLTYVGSWDKVPSTLVISKSICFEHVSHLGGKIGASDYGGNIVHGNGGRPDGRFFDVIYASGQGGVCRDMRYSAWGLKAEDFAEADLKVKSGEYRGRELVQHTQVIRIVGRTEGGSNTALARFDLVPEAEKLTNEGFYRSNISYIGKDSEHSGFLVFSTGKVVKIGQLRLSHNIYEENYAYRVNQPDPVGERLPILAAGEVAHIVVTTNPKDNSSIRGTSIAGEYTHTEVIGDPANILQCDDLKDGWIGSWNPELPGSGTTVFNLTRPVLSGRANLTYLDTLNDYSSWAYAEGSLLSDSISSLPTTRMDTSDTGGVGVLNYKTKAKMTTDSINSGIYGGNIGVGDAYVSSRGDDRYGRGLGFSTTGKINKSSAVHPKPSSENLCIQKYTDIGFIGKLYGLNASLGEIEHEPINLHHVNNSPAFKALNYNAIENQQGFINYAYTELKHNGTDWGDDSKIHIADNQTTMLDTNGNAVKVGTARIVEPLGWIKNDK